MLWWACYTLSKESPQLGKWYALQKTIGITFNDIALLEQALAHPSYTHEKPGTVVPNNERLEFLGDSLLNFIVTEELYRRFPGLTEGELTELRISLIRQDTLAEHALRLGLGHYLLLGKGEELTGGRERETNLADAFEALVGAIFLDQGIDAARRFVLAQFSDELKNCAGHEMKRSYKTLLQEFTQANFGQLPAYHIVEVSGPDHARRFTAEVRLGDQVLGTGCGRSKRAAEMQAARAAWECLNPGQFA